MCSDCEIEFSDLFCQKSRVDSFLNDVARWTYRRHEVLSPCETGGTLVHRPRLNFVKVRQFVC